MSRRSRSSEETFSLFPFLAVLLCTMGTLTMIFVAVAKRGSDAPEEVQAAEQRVEFDPAKGLGDAAQYGHIVDAKTLTDSLDRNKLIKTREKESSLVDLDETDDAAEQKPEEEDAYTKAREQVGNMSLDDVLGEQESVDWFLEEIRSVRERTESSLNEQRDRLAAAEASLERLRADLEVSQRKYDELFSEKKDESSEDAVALQDKINLLDVEITQLQQEAAKLREENKDAKASYAIVPYQGKEGTFRRPIFIECNKDGVFLMPERVQFPMSDFLVANYPGNPFDVALRAVASNYVELNGGKTQNGQKIEPYPLLVVRPGGAECFYMALAALASWGDDYGYEFIEEDQKIEYPQADPNLRLAIVRQTEAARQRLSVQIAAAYSAELAQAKAASFDGASYASGGMGGGSASGSSELQSRLGSNVRVGAAKVGASSGLRENNSGAIGGTGSYAGATPSTSSGASGLYGGGSLGAPTQGLAGNSNGGLGGQGVASDPLRSTDAWQTVHQYGGGVSSLVEGPLPQYTGEYSQYVTSAPSGEGAEDGGTSGSALAGGDGSTDSGSGVDGVLATTGTGADGASGQNGDGGYGGSSESGSGSGAGSSYAQSGSSTQYASSASGSSSANAPGFMANMISSDGSQSTDGQNVDYRQTLGNTTYASNAHGESAQGTLSKQKNDGDPGDAGAADGMLSVEKRLDEDKTPKEAIRLSQETPVTSSVERGILVRCDAQNFIFPKQPGMRKESRVSVKRTTPDQRSQELLDSISVCIKSWGLAGRNAYWAPYLKVEVAEGGEERFRELSEFCQAQGLSIVRVETNATTK